MAASLFALLAADAAFGLGTGALRLPNYIANNSPDLLPEETIRRGIGLMVDNITERDPDSWDRLAEIQGVEDDPRRRSQLLDAYFRSVYSEEN